MKAKTLNKPKSLVIVFGTGWLQLVLIAVNMWQIAHDKYLGVFLAGVLISFVWTINVKRIAFGSWPERVSYALGAGVGSLCGLLGAKLFYGG